MGILIKNNLLKLIQHHFGLFLIVILSLAFSTFGVLFFSGYFAYSYYSIIGINNCEIQIDVKPESSKKEIARLITELSSSDFSSITSMTVSDGNPQNSLDVEISSKPIGKTYFDNTKGLLTGRSFTKNENNPVMLLSEDMAASLEIPNPLMSSITVDSIDYTIVGILLNAEPTYIIPTQYYIQHYPVTKIKSSYLSEMPRDSITKLLDNFDSIVSSCNVVFVGSPFLSEDFIVELVQILLIFSFTFLNIASVIMLWQKLFGRQYSIYWILGCPYKLAIGCIFIQILIIILIGILLGLGIHLLLLPIFINFSLINERISDCLVISGFVFFLTFIFAGILSIRTVFKREKYKIEE